MILDRIVEHKRREVAEAAERRPLEQVRAEAEAAEPPRDFRAALAERSEVALIAEIKRSSPSAGLIRADFDPARIAKWYAEAGAAAMSVLTDAAFFGGSLDFVAQARAAAPMPALRKDFVIDAYQVFEARAAGADAVLLIVRILSDEQLVEYLGLARRLGMAALVETHSREEVARAVTAGADILGINNRDLDTLTIDLETSRTLARDVPPGCVLVSESGIQARGEVERLAAGGIDAILVGQTLMQSDDVARAARELTGVPRFKRS
jgi:indole-3-glycerol phosphate synthase